MSSNHQTAKSFGGKSDEGISTISKSARALAGRRALFGGAFYIVATLQYALVQVVTAAAWNPPYSWFNNYISDLGNTACGPFAVPHGTPIYVCSPLSAAMNASFVLAGVLLIGGTVLLWRFWPSRNLTTTALVLLLISGLGKVGVGLVPENTNISLHTATAFNIPIGGIAILMLSIAVLHNRPALGVTGVVAASVGLIGGVLSTAAQFGGSAALLGLGVGGMERVAGFPSNIWMLVVGVIAIMDTRSLAASRTNQPEGHATRKTMDASPRRV